MYIRQVAKRDKKNAKIYTSYHLVESKRINGMPRQNTLLVLGKLEGMSDDEINLLEKYIKDNYYNKTYLFDIQNNRKIKELARFYSQKLIKKQLAKKEMKEENIKANSGHTMYVELDINSFINDEAKQIGGEFLCFQAIQELGLQEFLQNELQFKDYQVNQALLSLTARLLHPASELASARWLNSKSAALEFYQLSGLQVNKNQLYNAANQIYKNKKSIETFLNKRIESIYNLERTIVLYDLTNSHFEGQMKLVSKAEYGKNKQKRNDCKQISLGLVNDENGFPLHSEYYEGNIYEAKTLKDVVNSLSQAQLPVSSSQKQCVVMDAGISNEENLSMLLSEGFDYITVSKSKHKELIEQINTDNLIKFKNKSGKEISTKLFTQKKKYTDKFGKDKTINESIIYVKSPLKEKKEQAINQKKCDRFEKGLEGIKKTIENPRGKHSVEKIHQRIGRLKERNKGITGYFTINLKEDKNKITEITWLRETDIKKEAKQGVYFIRTSIPGKDEQTIWNLYRTINEVEETYNVLKSILDMRPNFHQKDATVEAHINMCILAYYIVSFIRYRLKQKGIKYKWEKIREIMSSQKCTTNAMNTKSKKTLWVKSCTRPNVETQEIYDAMRYKIIPYYRKILEI
ncbi:MAG: IS1634 family transposase [Bacteroidota bacterium]|nr:IS1634 family transposase [Bacteroidota bacterium]